MLTEIETALTAANRIQQAQNLLRDAELHVGRLAHFPLAPTLQTDLLAAIDSLHSARSLCVRLMHSIDAWESTGVDDIPF